MKKNHIAKVLITVLLALFFWTFTCMNINLFTTHTTEEIFQLGYFITALASSVAVFVLGSYKFRMNKAAQIIAGSLTYIIAILGSMQLSIILAGGFASNPYIYFINILFWLAFAAVGLIISGSMRVSAIISVAASYAFNGASFMVYCFRGTALMPSDIMAFGTAMNVASHYEFDLQYPMITATVLAAALIMLAFKFPLKTKFKYSSLIMRGIGAVVLAASVGIVAFSDFTDADVSVYDQSQANYNYGSAFSFYINSKKMGLKKSDTYDPEKLDEKLASYEQPEADADMATEQPTVEPVKRDTNGNPLVSSPISATEQPAETLIPTSTEQPEPTEEVLKSTLDATGKKPNIIVVMNESFSDLKTVGDFETNEDYMPFFRSLENNTIKGQLLVSPFGGYTCNTEYEFLTGMSTGVLQSRVAPYLQMIFGKLPYSLPMHMRELGYKAIALHPFSADSWNRTNVYQYLSFDEFVSEENLSQYSEYPEHIRGLVSDKGNYGAILNMLLAKDPEERDFIFNITIQNHGGYTNGLYKNRIFLQNMQGNYPETEQYLSLIKDSDDALRYFLTELKKFNEPMVVVMFGDHLPSLEQGFYEELYGKPLSSVSLEESLRRYEVPFMIWANYDIEEEQDVLTSPCFLSNKLMEVAKLPESRVQMYLDELQEDVVQINPAVYTDTEGEHHRHSDLSDKIGEYYDLQYALLKGARLHYDFQYDKDSYSMFGSEILSPKFFFGKEYEKIKSANP